MRLGGYRDAFDFLDSVAEFGSNDSFTSVFQDMHPH